MKKIIAWVLCLVLVSAFAAAEGAGGDAENVETAESAAGAENGAADAGKTGKTGSDGEELYVKKIENLPEDFILGMDVSSVLSLEKSGVVYRDREGNEKDLFELLADAGVNWIRVRVWNDPFTAVGKGYGGGNTDAAAAAEIGRRAAEHGMKLLVDFHYSDFWADPSKQMVPKAWKGLSLDEKAEALYSYTLESLKLIRDAGADIGMVQIGNETNGRFCGEKIWMNMVWNLMSAGCRAVREFDPGVKIAVHFANPENTDTYLNWASKLAYYSLDYDIFATSYYPYWHGTLENLKFVLGEIKAQYGKDVMVAETSYAYTLEDTDFSGNTIGEGGAYDKPWPFTVQGQANEVRDVAAALNEIGALGLFYWEGAWISVGTNSWEENHQLWEEYGSGWASSAAGEYDPDDAGKYYGGSACDNQALFAPDGRALPSLSVFRLLREGNETALRADSIEDILLTVDIRSEVTLPETVNAVMNDGSRSSVPVTWNIPEGGLDTGREAVLTVEGTADGLPALCTVKVLRFNYAGNFSFEEEDLSMWHCDDQGGADELYCEEKKNDSLTGNRHWHFYSARANTVKFTLEQEIPLAAGNYDYRISIMGGDAGDQEVYSYVKIDGEIVETAPAAITSYNQWDTPSISFACAEGQSVVCGISVRCDGAGAWGKIDDMTVCAAE